jgi:aryl-alcohol dehydrogenase-like predicted oxidoreductase
VIEGAKNCLKRLQLDYVDIIYCHRFDQDTPIEETIRAMNYVIEKGWALYWGTSEWSAAQIFEAFAICEKYGLIKPVVEQPQYNLFFREKVEKDFYRLFKNYGYGSTIWGPLCSGILSGKYN